MVVIGLSESSERELSGALQTKKQRKMPAKKSVTESLSFRAKIIIHFKEKRETRNYTNIQRRCRSNFMALCIMNQFLWGFLTLIFFIRWFKKKLFKGIKIILETWCETDEHYNQQYSVSWQILSHLMLISTTSHCWILWACMRFVKNWDFY